MIICSSNNIDFIQGVVSYGNEPLITDWRIANSNGVFNIFNSKSNIGNLSMLESGNLSIGTSSQSGSLNVYGDINITGIYKKDGRDIINDTSNYISRLSLGGGGGSSQWVTSGANANDIYYNIGNVGIGTSTPTNKLHIRNDATSTTSLTIQNNFQPSLPNEIIIAGTTSNIIGVDRSITFPYSGTATTKDYTFTTTQSIFCDILIVGGGGAGGTVIGGGGGSGSIIYATNFNVPSGTYTFNVGRGGISPSSSSGAAVGGSGISSSAFGATAIGGGGGGYYSGYNGTSGGSGGGCGGGGIGPQSYSSISAAGSKTIGGTIIQTATFKEYLCNDGGFPRVWQTAGNQYVTSAGGGGGAIGVGGGTPNNATKTSTTGNGGVGKSYDITGTNITYGGGGGGGGHYGASSVIGVAGSGGSGGGGAGGYDQPNSAAPYGNGTNGEDGKGGGGGGSSYDFAVVKGGNGGSGIIILRYRVATPSSASIELIRGVTNDSNADYKIGNYAGEFKIISSTSNIDTEYVRITSTGSISNPSGTTSWTTTSDKRIKENIEEASYDKCYQNINSLGLYRFNYVQGFNNVNKDIKQLGFIAQEVNEIFPKSVLLSNNYNIPDLLTIDITQINYTLFGAVKKLIKQNDDKDRRIKRLETLLNIEDVTIDTSNIAIDTSNIAIDTSNIAIDTSNIALDTSNIALDAEQYYIRYLQYFNGYTSNISVDTSNIATE